VSSSLSVGYSSFPSLFRLIFPTHLPRPTELYAASRTLYALAIEGKAPAIFRRTSRSGLPIYCIGITSLFGLIAFVNAANISTGVIFNWVRTVSSLFFVSALKLRLHS